MEFSLTQDHQLLSETARKVGEEFGLEYWRALDANKEFAFDFWQKVSIFLRPPQRNFDELSE